MESDTMTEPEAAEYMIAARTFHIQSVDSVCDGISSDPGPRHGMACGKPSSIDVNAYRLNGNNKEPLGYAQFCAACFQRSYRRVFGIPQGVKVIEPELR